MSNQGNNNRNLYSVNNPNPYAPLPPQPPRNPYDQFPPGNYQQFPPAPPQNYPNQAYLPPNNQGYLPPNQINPGYIPPNNQGYIAPNQGFLPLNPAGLLLCPYCQRQTGNVAIRAPGGVTWIWCFALFICTGICCFIPFCCDSCHDTVFRCMVCQGVKGRVEANCC